MAELLSHVEWAIFNRGCYLTASGGQAWLIVVNSAQRHKVKGESSRVEGERLKKGQRLKVKGQRLKD